MLIETQPPPQPGSFRVLKIHNIELWSEEEKEEAEENKRSTKSKF